MYPNLGYIGLVAIHEVRIARKARRDLRQVPSHVLNKFMVWVDSVQRDGLEETRKIRGYHDEPLQGTRQGQRSIRLNLSYRAIYEIGKDGVVELASVEELNKHEY